MENKVVTKGKFDDFERVEDAAKKLARAIIWESFYIDGGAKEEEVEEHLKKFCEEKITDVIENVSKNKGIHMLIRSMAPEIIACDEIGSKDDIEAINYAFVSGVKGIFTMHGSNIDDIKNNIYISSLIENKQIEKILFL